MELDEEIDAIDPELYRASSSQLMKYAEEELIREEEINRKLEKRRSTMPLGKSKTPGKTKSMKSFDNGEITMKSRRLFNAPQSPSSQQNTEVMKKLNQDIRASLFGPEE